MRAHLNARHARPVTLLGRATWLGLAMAVVAGVNLVGVEQDQDGPAVVFRTGVEMVEVSATVRGRDGHLISDLTREDFRVLVDRRSVPIEVFSNEPRPLTVAILVFTALRGTASVMAVERARAVGHALVDALGADDVAVIGSMSDEIALSPHLTSDKAILHRVLEEELWPGPINAVGAVANLAMSTFEAAGEERRRAIVFIGPDHRDRCADAFWHGRGDPRCVSARDATRRAQADGVLIYGLPLPRSYWDSDGYPVMLMSRDTGGGYAEVSDDEDLAGTMARVVEGLRRDYLIGFTPRDDDGREHRVEVRVDRPGTRVFARRTFRSEATR